MFDMARLGVELAGMLFIGLAAFYGVKTAVKVVETKVAMLDTALSAHVLAINQRITDLSTRVK